MRKLALMFLTLAVSALVLGGCYRHNYVVTGAAYPEPAFEDNFHSHLFFGLANIEGDINLAGVCPTGFASIHNKISFVNALVSMVTANIYTPTTTRVYCAQGGADAGSNVAVTDETAAE